MLVIPAVDIKGGRCVRLYMGDKDRETVYGDPVDMALKWQGLGARRLHLVDLDGAFGGKPANLDIIREICSRLTIPVEVGGGIRSVETVEALLEAGVKWVILGTVLVEDQTTAREVVKRFPGRVIAGIDARDGRVAVKGWEEGTTLDALDLARWCQEEGFSAIIYTDISRDGTLTGPNLKETARIARSVSLPVIASGGVSSLDDILEVARLEVLGVEGVIVGRALYDGRVDLREALEALEGEDDRD